MKTTRPTMYPTDDAAYEAAMQYFGTATPADVPHCGLPVGYTTADEAYEAAMVFFEG